MDPQDYNQCSSGSSQEFSSTPPIFEANFDGDANGAFDNLRDILSAQLNVSVPNGLSSAPSAINLLFDTLDTPVLSPVVLSTNEMPVETVQNFAPAAPLAEPTCYRRDLLSLYYSSHSRSTSLSHSLLLSPLWAKPPLSLSH